MRLNVSAWSIRQPMPSFVAFAILIVLGLVSFSTLPVTKFPNIDIPIVQIQITQSGAAPSELESQVTKKVEDAVSSINGIWHIISSVTDGASVTTIQFHVGSTDVDRAVNSVKDQIAKIRSDLPRGINEPIVSRIDLEGLPIVAYAASAPAMTTEDLSWFVDDKVKRALQGLQGVGGVTRFGGVDREIRVALDPQKLLALGITAASVNAQIRATNTDLAGGRGEIAGQEQAIRTLAGARRVEDLASLPIALSGGRKVRLDDLGTVADGAAEVRTFARLDGKPVVTFGITRAKGSSDADVAERVAAKVAEIERDHPEVQLQLVDSQVDSTIGSYHSALETLAEGAALSVIVVFLFLRDVRATLVAALALPLSAIPTFWAIELLGFSLNMVSLLAITLVTGILVDDAIVEIENIVRHMRQGKSAYRASMEAADEIGLAVIAISMTIVAVFAPVSFMGGIPGQYFRQFGLTVAVAVVFSLLVARLITPVIAAYFLRAHPTTDHGDGVVMRFYTRLVRGSIRLRWLTLVVGALLFAASLYSSRLLPEGFMPAEDVGRTLLAVELPPGSRLDDTDRATRQIVDRIAGVPEVRSVLVYGGQILGGLVSAGGEVRKATLVVNLAPRRDRSRAQKDIQADVGRRLGDVADIRFWFLKDNGQRDVSFVIAGPDQALINETANRLASEMRTIPFLENPMSTAELERPELQITPRRQLAADLGVSTEALAETIRVATLGDTDANLAKFNAGDRQLPIRVRLADRARADMGLLEALRVPTAGGASVPLEVVADFRLGTGPTSITRLDRERRVTIEADLVGDTPLGLVSAAIHDLPTAKALPKGVEIRNTGDVEIMRDIMTSFMLAIGAGVMMVYAVLVLLFANLAQPITILLSLPFSIGGAIFALFLTNEPISLPVVIGILMLIGIVTKNAIMLVDFAMEEMARGTGRLEALVEAGRKRARPIVMTTIAMVAGMVPSALALGDGGEFRAPMAIAVIGGLVVATMLSLVFVPALFTFLDDLSRLVAAGFFRIFRSEADQEGELARRR
jgi:hydrophobe/amphiphile efflux-1 (HAE1) family protein